MRFTSCMRYIIFMLMFDCHSLSRPRNFALNKPAYQSSTLSYNNFYWIADKAVDGNTDGSNPDTSRTCSETAIGMGNHTWEVDIGFMFIVNHVVIYERSDGRDQLSSFQVIIGNQSNPWSEKMVLKNKTSTRYKHILYADDILARFVSVIHQNKETMTLCEVEVYGECLDGMYSELCNRTCGQCSNGEPCNKDTGECLHGCEPGWTGLLCYKGPRNFALNKPAYQSSTERFNNFYWIADKAVDGNTDGSNPDTSRTCSATANRMENHIWEVDIGFMFIVSHVVIYERSDGLDQLSGFLVMIGNRSNPWRENIALKTKNSTRYKYILYADDTLARFVSVILQNKETMTLCEVEVYGECLDGMYSEFCNRTCGQCANGEPCNKDTGECLHGCEPGWTGHLCNKELIGYHSKPRTDNQALLNISSVHFQHIFSATDSLTQIVSVIRENMELITLGEIELDDGLRNFALKKSAYQSSTFNYTGLKWTADNAVDGNTDGSNLYPSMTCILTDIRLDIHTWEVDIGFLIIVNHVVIYERSDRLYDIYGFQVFIGNHSNPWNANKPLQKKQLSKFRHRCIADNSIARFVSVIQQNEICLTLCEVEIYGECLDGMFSEFCNHTCGHCSNGEPCNKDTGECLRGCEPGWTGLLCDKECTRGTYGSGCTYTCGQCLNGNETCSGTDGRCSLGCDDGWQGDTCKDKSSAKLIQTLSREDMTVIGGSVVGVCVGAFIISIIIIGVLKKVRNTDTGDPEMGMNETGVSREQTFGDTATKERISPSFCHATSLGIPTTTASRDDVVAQISVAEYEELQDPERIESSIYCRINGTETDDTNYYNEDGLHI